MQVVQATFGTFHHFDLARELEARGQLKRIYSTFPWRRLRREGVSREHVRSFPLVQIPQLALGRMFDLPPQLTNAIMHFNATTYDRWLSKVVPECDAYVALSGCAVWSGRAAQRRGAKYVCDRGSSHMRYQLQILGEEYRLWGLKEPPLEKNVIERAEAEYAQADAITVPSEFARGTFLEMGVDLRKVRTMPLGVRLDRFMRTETPPADSFDVLFAGTVSIRKGIPYLLDAFSRFRHPNKTLRLAGPVEPAMNSLLSRFDLANVEVLGRMPQEELARLMSRSHVMVLPSIEDGFGLVMAQAMACGGVVIASEHTGGPDLFADGVEGFIVPIRSPEAICERLTQLADDPDERQRMSEAGLRRVQSLGGWHDYGRKFAAFLETLI